MQLNIRKGKKEDCSAVLELIRELAVYEKEPDAVDVDLTQLEEDGFGEDPAYDLLVGEIDGEIKGCAIYYQKYSTWKGRALYLEDLIVTESARGKGLGLALFKAVIQEAYDRAAGRMEWQVLDWNKPAIDFYKDFGASIEDEWLNGRFSKEQIAKICEA
ncbi:MAG: GNAT family N-acetyltransferase [Flavobacteriales bacterium]|nr:GNAT family N-acetyltransferase [Flavobacteriales bacterium]